MNKQTKWRWDYFKQQMDEASLRETKKNNYNLGAIFLSWLGVVICLVSPWLGFIPFVSAIYLWFKSVKIAFLPPITHVSVEWVWEDLEATEESINSRTDEISLKRK